MTNSTIGRVPQIESALGRPLHVAEIMLRRDLAGLHASPFLGHHGLSSRSREALRTARNALAHDSFAAFLRLFDHWPVTTAAWLAIELAEHYGSESGNEVYPHIARIIGRELQLSERARLHKAFRRTCGRFGFTLPPPLRTGEGGPGKFVNDYLVQAGASHAQLPPLVEAFSACQASFGVPPVGDSRALSHWGELACKFLSPGLTRLRLILAHDDTGYHAASFLRLRAGAVATTQFERALEGALQEARAKRPRRAAAGTSVAGASIMLIDAQLVVSAPRGGPDLRLDIGTRETRLPSGGTLPLDPPLPVAVRWRPDFQEAGTSGPWQPLSISRDQSALLVFDADTGVLMAELVMTSDREHVLDAGEYAFVARAPFLIGGESSVWLGGGVHLLYARLVAALSVELSGAKAELRPAPRARLVFRGRRLAQAQGLPLLASPLQIDVVVPPELYQEALEISVERSGASPLRLPLEVGEAAVLLDLTTSLPSIGTLAKARVALALKGIERPLASAAFWHWPGLSELRDGRSFKGPIPENFSDDYSRHIIRDGAGRLALRADVPFARARLAFRLERDDLVAFELPRPGVSIALLSPDGTERMLAFDEVLTLGTNLDHVVVVRSSDPSAVLDVRGRIERSPWGRDGARRLSLASLNEAGSHDQIRWLPGGDETAALVLARLRPGFAPASFRTVRHHDALQAELHLSHPIDAVRIEAEELLSGDRFDGEVPLGRRPVERPIYERAEGAVCDVQRAQLLLTLPCRSWPGGAWLARFLVREEGGDVWRPLLSPRGDTYGLALPIEEGHWVRTPAVIAERDVFVRMSRALAVCYAKECWEDIENMLLKPWISIGQDLASRPGGLQVLLRACRATPTPAAGQTWIPLHHPLEIAPTLFSAPAAAFRELEAAEDGSSALAVVADTADCQRVRDAMAHVPVSPIFFTGFANFPQASQNASVALSGFRFPAYATAADVFDRNDVPAPFWSPERGHLTQAHHGWACARLAETVRQARQDPTRNRHRLPLAALLARSAGLPEGEESLLAPETLANELDLVRCAPSFFSAFARASRREAYCDGAIWTFFARLAQRVQRPINEVIRETGYLARLGEELLAFYLLFWELVERTENP